MRRETVGELGEFGLIDRIRRWVGADDSGETLTGIGDDAAVIAREGTRVQLATCDILIEGRHFQVRHTDPEALGRRAIAVNLSDIAAMGGLPRWALISLALPPETPVDRVEALYRGMGLELEDAGAHLVGGNTSQADRLLVDVFLVGDADRREVVRRGPGQPGDRLFVTGWPGESAAGFHLLQREDEGLLDRHRHLVQRHQNPTPRLAAGRAVATSGAATAMIDLSDGLASDLRHLTLPYGLGAEIEGIRFPFSSELRLCVEELSLDPLELALTGGEDYELLFALDSAKADTVLEGIRSASHCPVTEIGRLTDRTGELKLVESDGRVRAIRGGWDHFGRDQQTNRDEP